jgi:YHS domain-containing protein
MKIRTFGIISTMSLVAVIAISGCTKDQPPASQDQDHSEHEHAAITEEVTAAADTEQTVCPVMDGKINKELYTEYKGKKVYFCCPGCEEEFNKNPEKYISKLPQFKEQ